MLDSLIAWHKFYEIYGSLYKHGDIIIAVFVDDMLILGPSKNACNAVATELSREVEVVNKGEVKSFLGLNVTRNYKRHRYCNKPAWLH